MPIHPEAVSADPELKPRPLLKWAGGKRQLLPEIRKFYPIDFGRYFEPFAGSAAVFFDLVGQGAIETRSACLLDTNEDLIGCYQMVRDHVDDVIRELRALERDYRMRGDVHFYEVRDSEFNPSRLQRFNGRGSLSGKYTPRLAALLIFLNRTGFNGLFRLNSKGLFNVPHGRYSNPLICDDANLRAVSNVLRRRNVQIVLGSFEQVADMARVRDFIYFDPPYAPMSSTSDFTAYTAQGFATEDQARLQRVVLELAQKGCLVLLSNSTAPEIRNLYVNRRTKSAGVTAYKVPARRAINSDPDARGAVYEYLITNIELTN
jgi:DNA adenine methylase